MSLAKAIHTLTRKFPRVRALLGARQERKSERYGLSAQMRSAATSVPLNIAEGQCRRGTKEFLLHLSHAQGSLGELESQLLYAVSVGYCSQSEAAPLCQEILELHKMIRAIHLTLSRRSRS